MAWKKVRKKDEPDVPFDSIYYNTSKSCCTIGTDANRQQKGRKGANVLDNCVGFAVGAYVETFMKNKDSSETAQEIYNDLKDKGALYNSDFPFQIGCNANCILDLIRHSAGKKRKDGKKNDTYFNIRKNKSAAALYDYIVPVEDKPPVGGLIMWGGSANHVAYISSVSKNGNKITILHAGWQHPEMTTTVSGGYNVTKSTRTRSQSGVFSDSGKCLGYLRNPAVELDSTSTPQKEDYDYEDVPPDTPDEDVPASVPQDDPIEKPSITSVTQKSATEIVIKGKMNEKPSRLRNTKLYYKWGSSVSDSDHTGTFTSKKSKFEFTLDKPRNATKISILPVNIDVDKKVTKGDKFTESLQESYPAIYIHDGEGGGKLYTPLVCIENNGKKEWVEAIPTVKTNNHWYELYNTGKEEVK